MSKQSHWPALTYSQSSGRAPRVRGTVTVKNVGNADQDQHSSHRRQKTPPQTTQDKHYKLPHAEKCFSQQSYIQ